MTSRDEDPHCRQHRAHPAHGVVAPLLMLTDSPGTSTEGLTAVASHSPLHDPEGNHCGQVPANARFGESGRGRQGTSQPEGLGGPLQGRH